jgi:5'(3')-deoxyribonucleotidase
MNEEQFCLGVDLDGVVADFPAAMHPLVAEWKGVRVEDLRKPTGQNLTDEYDLQGYGGYPAVHRWAVIERDLFKIMPPVKGAAAALRRLSAHDIRIRIVTHRLYVSHFHRQAVTQTVDFLDHYGIPYWDLCFLRDKTMIDANLFIDDSPEQVNALRAAGKAVVCFGDATNVNVSPPRLEAWPQVEEYVLARQAEWLAQRGR